MLHRLLSALVDGSQPHGQDAHTHQDTFVDELRRPMSMPGTWPATCSTAPHASSGFFAGSSNVDASHSVFIDTSSIINVTRDLNIRVEMQENDKKVLEKLPRAKGAGFRSDNHSTCLEGTRKAELQRIEKWIGDYTTMLIYWLGGIAGSGKSTIAQTIAERCYANGQLGGTFFCSRDSEDRRNIRLIFPTLAYYLALHSPEFRAALIQILNEFPDVASDSLSVQFQDLIIRPLLMAKVHTTIIIDALDECDDDDPASAILSVMARQIHEVPFVKFFVTGRPELPIRSGFRLRSLRPHTEVFMLHEIDRTIVDEDIALYLRTNLSLIPESRSYWNWTIAWPSNEEIIVATMKCAGLFIVAYVIVKFVGSRRHDPRQRLRMLIEDPDSTFHEGRSGVDATYDYVFHHGFDDVDADDVAFFDLLHIVVGSVVIVFNPLSCASLAMLLCKTPEDVGRALDSLHSVFIVPDSETEPIRICHKSLADYLTDAKRCTDPRFYINPAVVHLELGLYCLQLMNVSLKTNICGLPRYAMNADIRDMATRREKYIGNCLEYACRSWAKHLMLASRDGDSVSNIVRLLEEFFRYHLLQWLEVLSIIGDLGCAVYSFRDMKTWITDVVSSDARLLAIVDDSEKFVVRFFEAIESSATHIYESALLLSPLSSLVRNLYRHHISTNVVMHGIDNSWNACIKEIQSQNGVLFVAFSYKEDLIAVGEQEVVEIFQAATGQRRTTFALPTDSVSCLMFSPDDTALVTGCDSGRVSVLDLQTGGLVDTSEEHTGEVTSVVFSPCGSMIATSSYDCTVRIWTLFPLHCQCILEGHLHQVRTICWSNTGGEVISGSYDATVKVWSISVKKCTNTFTVHTGAVCSIASSPDASLIASGSTDGTIKVFNADTGNVLHTISTNYISIIRFLNRDQIMYAGNSISVIRDLTRSVDVSNFKYNGHLCQISSDGTRLASSDAGVVKIWQTSIRPDENQDIISHHVNKVWDRGTSFSKDGQLAATASLDTTAKIWDTSTGQCITTFRGHSGAVYQVSLSPDSTVCASYGSDRVIQIWDVQSGSQISTLVPQERSRFVEMCFSPKPGQVASLECGDSGWVKLWEVATGTCFASIQVKKTFEEISFAFDMDGSSVTLKGRNSSQRWGISSAPAPNESSTDSANKLSTLPMVFIPLNSPDLSPVPHQPYRYDTESAWTVDKGERRVLWILPDWRIGHHKNRFHGNQFVFTSSTGRVIIGEFRM